MKISKYIKEDEVKIIQLFEKVFSQKMTLAFWNWRFKNQSFSDTLVSTMKTEDQIVGHYAACPIEFLYEKEIIKAGLSLTTMTDPNHTGKGIFPKLANHLYSEMKSNGYAFIYGFPNSNSHYGFIKKLNWENIASIPNLQLNTSNFNLSSSKKIKIDKDLSFNHKNYLAFLETTKSYKVKLNRSVDYLKWRYKENPQNKYVKFYFSDNELEYFAITKVYETSGSVEIDVLELVFNSDILILNELFSSILNFYKSESLDIKINTWLPLNDDKHILLEKIGFINKEPITYFGFYDFNNVSTFLNNRNWYFSMGDSDIY